MLRILLIEGDRPRRASHLEALLTIPESEVEVAGASEEALHKCAASPFDVAVADFVLPKPGLSGADTLLRVSEVLPQVRTVLFSGHDCVGDLLSEVGDGFLYNNGDSSTFGPQLATLVTRIADLDSSFTDGDPSEDGFTEDAVTELMPATGVDPASSPSFFNATPEPPRRATLIASKYRLIAEIGRGGMGIVYRAEDTFIGRPVALKLLHLRASNKGKQFEQRMRREVTIAGQLDHPNIVTVYDAGIENDEIFLVMKLIEGETLRDLLDREVTLPPEEATKILDQALSAAGYAHGRGVVHRDLKPENVLLTPKGEVKIADFGLAKLVSIASSTSDGDSSGSLKTPDNAVFDPTTEGIVVGTMAYMAPEQMIGSKVDHRADLYALGAMFFEMLDGRALEKAVPAVARMAGLHPGAAQPAMPDVGDPHLNRVLQRALAVPLNKRFQDADAFASALQRIEPPRWRRLLSWMKRK